MCDCADFLIDESQVLSNDFTVSPALEAHVEEAMREYVRRMRSASCLNIARCSLQRGAVEKSKRGVSSLLNSSSLALSGRSIRWWVDSSAEMLCQLSLSIQPSLAGRITLEAVKKEPAVHLQNVSPIDDDITATELFVSDYGRDREFSQLILGWVFLPFSADLRYVYQDVIS